MIKFFRQIFKQWHCHHEYYLPCSENIGGMFKIYEPGYSYCKHCGKQGPYVNENAIGIMVTDWWYL